MKSDYSKRVAQGLCGNAGCDRKPKQGKSRCEYHREQIKTAALRRNHNNQPHKSTRHGKVMTGGKSAQIVASLLQGCPEIEYVGLSGWPDLFFIRKDGKAGVIEVKDRDKLSAEQKRCRDAFASMNIVVQVLTPQMARTLYNGKPAPPKMRPASTWTEKKDAPAAKAASA